MWMNAYRADPSQIFIYFQHNIIIIRYILYIHIYNVISIKVLSFCWLFVFHQNHRHHYINMSFRFCFFIVTLGANACLLWFVWSNVNKQRIVTSEREQGIEKVRTTRRLHKTFTFLFKKSFIFYRFVYIIPTYDVVSHPITFENIVTN